MDFFNKSSEDTLDEAIKRHLEVLRSRLEQDTGSIHETEAQRKKLGLN